MGCVLCEPSTVASTHRSSFDVSSLSDTALEEGLAAVATARSRLVARETAMVAEIGRRKGDAREKLREQSRMSAAEARRAVDTAAGLEQLPRTKAALGTGTISPQNAGILARSAKDRTGRDSTVPVDEVELLPKATEQSPEQFAKTMRRWENEHRPDQAATKLKQQRRARKLSMWEDDESGMYILRAEFDPVTGARISTQLAAMTDRLWREEHGKNAARPSSNVRQRRADALEQLLRDSGEPATDRATTSTPGRQPGTTLLVVADLDTVTRQLKNGRLASGAPLPVEEIARLACEASIVPAFFDAKGQPLWLGRKTRLATPAQRTAVIARDQGCIACDAAPEWCQVHHIEWWRHRGKTDIDNLCLLCSQHHHLIHEGNAEIIATDTGFELHRSRKRRPPPSPTKRAA